jgi:hypothetical protein
MANPNLTLTPLTPGTYICMCVCVANPGGPVEKLAQSYVMT